MLILLFFILCTAECGDGLIGLLEGEEYDVDTVDTFYPSWTYRREITITEQASSGDLTEYQVLINLNSSNFDFGNADIDGDDIRFNYYDSSTEIEANYWIEEWDYGAEQASIWVNVPNIQSGSEAMIYMYYGYSGVTSLSDGENTFDFFDDFNDNIIDTLKWNTQGSVEETGGELVVSETIGIEYTESIPVIPVESAVRWRAQVVSSSCPHMGFLQDIATHSTNGPGHYFHAFGGGSETAFSQEASNNESTGIAFLNGYHIFEIAKTDYEGKFYIDGNLLATHTTYTPDGSIPLGFFVNAVSTDTISVDWVLVSKRIYPEPTISIGEEEIR